MTVQSTTQRSTQTQPQVQNSNLLRQVMLADGALTLLAGLALLAAANPLAQFLGLASTTLPLVLGVLFILFGADQLFIATRAAVRRSWAIGVIAVDVAFSVACWAVVLTGWPELTTAGAWAVAILGDLVAVVAILKYVGLRRL